MRLLAIAAWMGLTYGIVEGLESFLLSLLPQGLSWQNGNSVDALLYMPVLYLVAYLLTGALLIPVTLLLKRTWWDRVFVFVLAALSGYLLAWNQGRVFSSWASAIIGVGIGTVAVRVYRKHAERWRVGVARTLPLVALVGALVVGGTWLGKRVVEARRMATLPAIARDRPNILLIVLDTERADHLSSYGYWRPTTPHLDALAARGVLFEQAFSASSWTLPSHASLFTGLMVHQHNAGAGGRRVLDGTHPTLAAQLSSAGYASGGFVANIFWTGRHTGLARGFLHYEDFYGTVGDALHRMTLVRAFPWLLDLPGAADIRVSKRASHVSQDFLQWVDRLDGRPFFAFLNYMDVHAPYLPPESHEGRFGPRRPEFRPDRLEIADKSGNLPPPAQLAYRIDRYDESLNYLDESIGALLAQLDQRGLLQNTAIIVTSDHGEHFGEHSLVEHGKSLYTQETWVPMIISAPGGPVGARVSEPVSTVRMAATVASLAGLTNSVFPGHSLLDPSKDSVHPVLSELGSTGGAKGWIKSLVHGRWHFILRQSGQAELYDLERDREDSHDLINTREGRLVAGSLVREIRGIVRPTGKKEWPVEGIVE